MDELKRPCVVGGKIRAVTDAQHGRILQLVIEQAHDMALTVLVERSCRFVEKDPAGFVQQEPHEGETFLFAE
jgi:DNA mismatch repair protein MutH